MLRDDKEGISYNMCCVFDGRSPTYLPTEKRRDSRGLSVTLFAVSNHPMPKHLSLGM